MHWHLHELDPDRQLWLRLCWLYGKDRAALIMSGYDQKTRADVQRWNRLGSKKGEQ